MRVMNLVVKFQQYFFLLVAFLLGSLAPLYGNVFNFVLLAFIVGLAWGKQERDAPEFTICPLVYWD